MRLLLLSPNPLDPRLGASKVLLELGTALNALPGVECVVVGPEDIGTARAFDLDAWRRFSEAQRRFLLAHAAEFDVVDYDHEHLPFERHQFAAQPLFVARSVLLVHHLDTIRFPAPRTARVLVSNLVHGPTRARFQQSRIADATRTLQQADLINVSNADDKRALVARGFDDTKVVALPFGMTAARRAQFEAVPETAPPSPVVGFVGSFDFRKGAADFPALFARVRAAVPDATLALFGTTGHFRNADEVRAIFPSRLRPHVQIHPQFDPGDLPTLLSTCSVGVFPSYCEGFGFGVLEMLAAAMPVVAYDAPGPPEMLQRERLVQPGDIDSMAAKVVELLRDPRRLALARRDARQAAGRFDWLDIAQRTVREYQSRLDVHARERAAMVTA